MSTYRNPKSQFWWCVFKVNGQRFRLSTGETDRKRAEEAEISLRAEKIAEAPKLRRGVGSMEQLAAFDIERASSEKNVTAVYEKTLTQMWFRILEAITVVDPLNVSADRLKAYVKERRTPTEVDGKTIPGMRGQTIIRELFALKRALVEAQRRGWIKEVPTFPRVSSDPKDPKQKGKEHDAWAVIAVLATVPDDVREAAGVCLATGIRFQELKRLRWDWVRPVPQGSKVAARLVLPAEGTKSRRQRFVGVPDWAYAILKARAAKYDGELFPRAGYRKALARACERLQYPKTVTLRDMRHTFASTALRNGGSIRAVADALGHNKLDTTWHYLSSGGDEVLNLGVIE